MFKKLGFILLVLVGLMGLLWFKFAPIPGFWLNQPVSSIMLAPPPTKPSRQFPVLAATPPTPRPEEIDVTLFPTVGGLGWSSNLDGRSYLAEPEIHVGSFEGHTFLGVLQFDLSAIPARTVVTYANLQLTGLDGQNTSPGGEWQVQLLDADLNADWLNTLNYDTLRQAADEVTVGNPLTTADVEQGQVNDFRFSAKQLGMLQSGLVNGVVTFRLKGPTEGKDNLFTWAGTNNATSGAPGQPQLHLRYVPVSDIEQPVARIAPLEAMAVPPSLPVPPPTLPAATPEPPTATLSPEEMVIVTSTPQPENIITVAAIAINATSAAALEGTFTPVPDNWVTPIVVTPQPTPANAATLEFLDAAATADTFLNGEASPTPPNLWTATPLLPTPTSTATPSPTPLTPVLVTATPIPENIVTVAAQAATATEVAAIIGTYTPAPDNWVTPMVVTPQPAPANAATATFRNLEATAQAFLNGDKSAPVYVWTATPTPFAMPVIGEVATPWVNPSPTLTPLPIPQQLIGKIAFLSDRSGGPEPLRRPLVYVVDPDGSNLAVLTDSTFYDLAKARDVYSSDQRFVTFVKEFPRYFGTSGRHQMVPAIFYFDHEYSAEEQITFFGAGEAWDPAWSPTGEQIAFVSNDSKDDEIWIVNRDGTGIQRLTETNEAFNAREIGKDTFIPEINGHPSWSSDGKQIVFWSNRSGHRQIWVMNADGSNVHSLSTTGYDDWNPVWIKYTDSVRH